MCPNLRNTGRWCHFLRLVCWISFERPRALLNSSFFSLGRIPRASVPVRRLLTMLVNVSFRHARPAPISRRLRLISSLCAVVRSFVYTYTGQCLNAHEIQGLLSQPLVGDIHSAAQKYLIEFLDPGTGVPTTTATVPSTTPTNSGTRTPTGTTTSPTNTTSSSSKPNHATHNPPAGVLGAGLALGLALFA